MAPIKFLRIPCVFLGVGRHHPAMRSLPHELWLQVQLQNVGVFCGFY